MHRRHAFTLIELIVALAIVALLAAIAIPTYSAVQSQAQQKAQTAQSATLAQALSAFYAVNGCYPDPNTTNPVFGYDGGNMPTNLGSYVGGPWPSNQGYFTLNSSKVAVSGSAYTAYYVGVISQAVWQADTWSQVVSDSRAALVVNNVAVPVC
jgi:prepilin-type N-terminal cleavage/methylation domain-containing protein